MSQKQQYTTDTRFYSPGKGEKLDVPPDMSENTEDLEDEALGAAPESPPWMMLIIGAIELGAGIYTNFMQVSTSSQAWLSSMLGSSAVQNLTVQQLLSMQPKVSAMALLIALIVQIIVVSQSQPMSSVWRRIRTIQMAHINVVHATAHAVTHLTLWQWLAWICFIGDVVGDVRYITLFTKDPLSVFFWIVVLSAGSTLVMLDGAQRLWGGVQAWRDYALFYQRYYPQGGDDGDFLQD